MMSWILLVLPPLIGGIASTVVTIRTLMTNSARRSQRFYLSASFRNRARTAVAALTATIAVGVTVGLATTRTAPTTTFPLAEPSVIESASSTDGIELGSYQIDLSPGQSVQVTPEMPTRSQFFTGISPVADIAVIDTEPPLVIPINVDHVFDLPIGAKPTYAACRASTLSVAQVSIEPATSFCLIEQGVVAGLSVISVRSGQVPRIALAVTTWQGS